MNEDDEERRLTFLLSLCLFSGPKSSGKNCGGIARWCGGWGVGWNTTTRTRACPSFFNNEVAGRCLKHRPKYGPVNKKVRSTSFDALTTALTAALTATLTTTLTALAPIYGT